MDCDADRVDAQAATPRAVPTFYFIGVTTRSSSIMRVFPAWMRYLGRPDVVIEGVNLAIHDRPERYRHIVKQIKHDPLSLGALVTTHKIDLLEAARDLFDDLDPYAELCGEVSSISKRGGRLQGHARDPISAGLSLEAILGRDYFARTGGHVLCFGAGGSGSAIALYLASRPERGDRPERLVMVNRSQPRLDALRVLMEKVRAPMRVEYVLNEDPRRGDTLLAGLPERSVIINATGMGKDRPGSPITDGGLFPRQGIAWELNYRGELGFLRQAERQANTRQVRAEDGWLYFVHGWTQVIAQVLHLEISPESVERMAAIAAPLRPGQS